MKRLFALGLAFALMGCAGQLSVPGTPSTQSSLQQLATFTVADLQSAEAIANSATPPDQIGAMCYGGLITFVNSLQQPNQPPQTVVGAFTIFEKGRIGINAINSGIPQYLKIDCGPLVIDTQLDAAKFLAAIASIGIK